MGAGIHRWWADGRRYTEACDKWRIQHEIRIAQAIVHASPRTLGLVRRVVIAFAEIWRRT